jgi:hypothetical protein
MKIEIILNINHVIRPEWSNYGKNENEKKIIIRRKKIIIRRKKNKIKQINKDKDLDDKIEIIIPLRHHPTQDDRFFRIN